jgi:hypothetical protein
MTKVERFDGIKPPPTMPIYRHPSQGPGRSDNPAGGPVSPDRYQQPPQRQGGTETDRLDE